MIIFANTQTINQAKSNSKTEAYSNPLWIVGGVGPIHKESCSEKARQKEEHKKIYEDRAYERDDKEIV